MNTMVHTERPKLKLNLAAKPLTLNTNANPFVTGPSFKKVVVFEKPKSDDVVTIMASKAGSKVSKDIASSDVTKDAPKAKSKDAKKSNKQEVAISSKKIIASPEEILKEKIKRRKKEYFTILTKLQADYPEVFSIDPKPLAIGIDLELKKMLNDEFANAQLGRFFHRYCGSFKYKEKLVEGVRRFNLDGSPATLVTKKEVPVIVNKPKFVRKSKDVSVT